MEIPVSRVFKKFRDLEAHLRPRTIYGALGVTYGVAFVSHDGDATYLCAAVAYLALARVAH